MRTAERRLLLLPLLLLGVLGLGMSWPLGSPVQAAPTGWIPLQCRLGDGAWQNCRLQVMDVGVRWSLQVGERRIEFRHDGSGTVTMEERGEARPVTARWLEDHSLCWDGTCARGDIPLD